MLDVQTLLCIQQRSEQDMMTTLPMIRMMMSADACDCCDHDDDGEDRDDYNYE